MPYNFYQFLYKFCLLRTPLNEQIQKETEQVHNL